MDVSFAEMELLFLVQMLAYDMHIQFSMKFYMLCFFN